MCDNCRAILSPLDKLDINIDGCYCFLRDNHTEIPVLNEILFTGGLDGWLAAVRCKSKIIAEQFLGFLTPLVLLTNLGLFLWGEIVGNVEGGANVLRLLDTSDTCETQGRWGGQRSKFKQRFQFSYRLPLDHTGDGGARQIEQRLAIQVVGSQNQLKKQNLLQVNKVGIPLLDNIRHHLTLQWLFDFSHGFLQVVFTELNHFAQDLGLHVGERNFGNLILTVLCKLVKRSIGGSS